MKTEELLLFGAAAYFLTRGNAASATTTTPTGGGGGGSAPPADEEEYSAAPLPGKKGAAAVPKKKPAAKKPAPKKKAPSKAGASTALVPTAPTSAEAATRIAGMKNRAYAKAAQAWIPDFIRAGASQEEAEGLARWAGLESSGNPFAQSVIGERGLLQCTKTTANMKGGVFTPAEWAELANKSTTRARHAQLAMKQFRWHVKRAKVSPNAPAVDRLWYAKAHHMRPVDLTATKARPDAKTAAAFALNLATQKKDARAEVRIAAANMVAFGQVAAPM